MDRVTQYRKYILWRTYIVGYPSDRYGLLAEINIFPFSQESNEEVPSVSSIQDLREEIQVRYNGRLEYDGECVCVEELYEMILRGSSDLPMHQG